MENPLDDIPSQIRRPRLSRPIKGRSGSSKVGLGSSNAARQRNIRQKFVALLKRFKVPDPEDLDQEQVDKIDIEGKLEEGSVDPAEIEDLFDELESFSDSDGPGIPGDSASIGSTPKPSLKPFFNSSRNLLHEAVVTANTQGKVAAVCKTSVIPEPISPWLYFRGEFRLNVYLNFFHILKDGQQILYCFRSRK